MVTGLQRLVGKRVVSVEVSAPVPDFVMLFEDELCLKVFCDQTNLRTADDNYSVRWGSTILGVGVRGHVVEEIRNPD